MQNSKDTLYVLCVIFNPRRFESRYRLYKQFAKYIEYSGAVLVTCEIAWDGRPFEVTQPHNKYHLQLRTDYEFWHKERGLNLALAHLKQIHPEARKVAWIDADVQFSNVNWVQDTLFALDHYDVVQPYSQGINLNPKDEMMWKADSLFANYVKKLGYHQKPPKQVKYLSGGHPGLAWAATIKALDSLGGLLDICAAGSGDTHMANCLMGDYTLYTSPHYSPGLMKAFKDWAEKCDRHIKRNIGFVHGICFHHWHGKSAQRGYEKRIGILCFHQFDPATDLVITDNGLYKWAGNKPELEHDVRLSLSSRNEDSIDE